MARLHNLLRSACLIALPVALPVALGGCAGALVVGGLAAAAGGGYAANQERGVNGAVNDFTIKSNIERAMVAADPRLGYGIATSVYEGRVLLVGRVPVPQMKSAAEQAVGRVAGVRTLYDELEVAPAEAAWDDAKDAWITTRVRSEMVLDPGIRSVNYTIDTANGSVYLIGSARSQGELDRATQIARYVPGVRRVVSYVQVRGGAPIAALPPPAPGTGMAPAGTAPLGGAPQSAIEVQKL